MRELNNSFNYIPGYTQLCKRWTLQILIKLGGHKNIFTEMCCTEDDLTNDFGLVINDGDHAYSRTLAIDNTHHELSKIERTSTKFPANTILAKNIKWLAENIGLNELEQRLILFFVLERQNNHLRTATESLGDINTTRLYSILGKLLNVNPLQIRKALHPSNRLCKSGLVKLDTRYLRSFPEKISLSSGISDRLLVKHKNPFDLFVQNFKVAGEAKLSSNNFPHLQQEVEHLSCYLEQSLKKGRTGINVLLYGLPGGGKTEFVKMLTEKAGFNLYEIAYKQNSGAPMDSDDRLCSYMLSQNVLEKSVRPVFLFDEIEDVFSNTGKDSEEKSNASGQKAWMNDLLENNTVPTFWVTNNISMIDDAHLRRFDYHLEMKAPPRNVRLKIIDEYTAALPISDAWRNAMADYDKVSPAVIERAKKVTTAIINQQPKLSAEKIMTQVISNSLKAMGLGEIKNTTSPELLNYQLDVVNASCDLVELTNGLRNHHEARLCLYGPPGTGKTAFGHHIAKLLDKPLLVKRSSDIVSPYLGMTERNMAKMFNEAQTTGAILLLDEADSFLRDRSGARHGWEVTAVNEMLTQMETFNGIFIASTNLMDQLDAASLRRFDLKIEFGYLKFCQSLSLFESLTDKLSISLAGNESNQLKQLTNLTPGDFYNVARQSKLTKISSGTDLLHRLSLECKSKVGSSVGRMGFVG